MDQTPIYDHLRRMVERQECSGPARHPPAHPNIYEELCQALGAPGHDATRPRNGRHHT